MKDNYNKGFLTGMLVTLGIVLGAVLVYFVFFHDLLRNSSRSSSTANYSNTGNEDYDVFITKQNNIMNVVREHFYEEVDDQAMYRGAYEGILASLKDPYAAYYSGEEYKQIAQTTSGEYVGIGCYVTQEKDTNNIRIVSVVDDSPAYKAGLLADDILIAVDGRDVTEMDLNVALTYVQGKEGTKVVITVKRGEERIDLTMIREKIEQKMIAYQMLEDNVGYIYIASFYKHVPDQVKEAIEELESQGMEKLIVDLRDDPGGLYEVAVDMVDIFIDRGLLVAYVEDNKGKQEKTFSKRADTFDKPTVILINGNSASASELFTQTLREYEKATVIGTTSYGKGVYQNLYAVANDGSYIKITGGRYYSAKGFCVDKVGIEPDITVEYVAPDVNKADLKLEDDNQIRAALDFLAGK